MISLGNIAPKVLYQNPAADNKDIRRLIEKLHKPAVKQTALISEKFRGKTDKASARNIWNFLKYGINYKADGANQVVKLPSALLRDKQGDCKSYALFTSAVLSNMGIPHYLVYTSYSDDPTPSHVYVQLKDGTIIDAVYLKFNKEKPSTYKYKKDMTLKGIAGPPGQNQRIGSLVNTDRKVSGAVHTAAKATFLIPRNAFRLLVKYNVWGLAKLIYDSYTYNRTTTLDQWQTGWYNLGGGWKEFAEALTEGYNKKPFGLNLAPQVIKDAYNKRGVSISGAGSTTIGGATVAGVIASATTIVLALGGLLKAVYDGASALPKDMGGDIPPSEAAPVITDPTTTPPASTDNKIEVPLIGKISPIALAALGIGLYFVITKK